VKVFESSWGFPVESIYSFSLSKSTKGLSHAGIDPSCKNSPSIHNYRGNNILSY